MGQPDMSQIIAEAQAMQARLQVAQQEILSSTVEGTAGQGLVNVTIDGTGKAISISIKPEVVDPHDVETLQDLVLGALADAHGKMARLAEEKMGPLAQGIDGLGGIF